MAKDTTAPTLIGKTPADEMNNVAVNANIVLTFNESVKAGVGIRFIRELEQGKATLQLDKVDQVLHLFGFQLTPNKQHIDAYNIFAWC